MKIGMPRKKSIPIKNRYLNRLVSLWKLEWQLHRVDLMLHLLAIRGNIRLALRRESEYIASNGRTERYQNHL